MRFLYLKLFLLSFLVLNTVNASLLFTTENNGTDDSQFFIDSEDVATDFIDLKFGVSNTAKFRFDIANNKFVLNKNLDLSNNQLLNTRIENLASAPTCDTTTTGKIYHNTTDNNSYICNGSAWEQIDGGADNLGNHIATANIQLNGNYLSNDGDNEGVFVDTEGHVGIGTPKPIYNLDIQDANSTARLRLLGHGAGYTNAGIILEAGDDTNYRGLGMFMHDYGGKTEWYAGTPYADSDSFVIAHQSGASGHEEITAQTTNALMTISNSGRMGIGTNTPSASLDVKKAELANSGKAIGINFEQNLKAASDNDILSALYIKPTFDDDGHSGVKHNALIVEGGNVGIGTSSPTSKLHIAGDIRHTASLVSQGANYASTWMRFNEHKWGNSLILGAGGLTVLGSGESSSQVKSNVSASDETLYLSSDGAIKFVTKLQSGWNSRVEPMTILSDGRIGIGTNSPKAQLHIATGNDVDLTSEDNPLTIGSTSGENIAIDGNEILARNNGAGAPLYLALENGATVSIGSGAGSSYKLNLPNDTSNDVGRARANRWDTYSDSRVKKNQKLITNGLEIINKLQPKRYIQYGSKFKDGKLKLTGNGEVTYGLIAQEMQDVLPEAVYQPEDETKDLWSVNYEKVIPFLISGEQELNKKIEGLADSDSENSNITDFVTSFFHNLFTKIKTWLADTENGIEKINSQEVEAEKICLKKSNGEKVCIDGDKLEMLMNHQSGSSS